MVPADKLNDVVDCFKRTLEEKNAFASGEVGLPYIIQTASRFGMDELIAKLITRPEHRSYYAFVKDGMTTLGEYWETNPRSHCHDMMGHIIEWYYSGIAGIKPLAPGFKRASVRPQRDGFCSRCITPTIPCRSVRTSGKYSPKAKRLFWAGRNESIG